MAEAGGDGGLQVHRTRHLHGQRHGGAQKLDRKVVGQPEVDDGRRRLGPGHDLEGHLGQHGKRAPAAGKPAPHVVARHVLHDAAAGMEHLGAAVDAFDAEQMVARGPGLDAACARQVGGEHRADRVRTLRAAHGGRHVDRLEREHLTVRGELGLDVRHGRAGARRHDELARLIKRDAAQRGGGYGNGAVDGPAYGALGAAAYQLDRQALLGTARNHELELPVGRGLL